MNTIHQEDWGLIDYQTAWTKQAQIFSESLAKKNQRSGATPTENIDHRFVFCEHPHVYTLGKHGVSANLLLSDDQLRAIDATYYQIDRGGDITYHGPGQIVAYPLLDLEALGISLKHYVFAIEETVIRTLSDYDIAAGRCEGATGVWIGEGNNARKICAIGIRASRHLTMHGFALNVNTDLRYFSYINPCGFIDKGVSSIALELGRPIDMQDVKQRLFQHFQTVVMPVARR